MAKGDKGADKPEGEEYKFEVPDFDEDAFIHKEMVSFRTTTVLFLWGIIAAILTWLVYTLMGGAATAWYIGLGIVAVFGYALRYLYPRLKIDISHFGRREWLGTGFLLFFTWLAFALLFLNPPISDHAEPRVEILANPPIQMAGQDITFNVFYEDNNRVSDMTFTLTHGSGQVLATFDDMVDMGHGHFQYVLPSAQATTYTLNATAEDPAGHKGYAERTVTVSARAVRLDASALEAHELKDRTQVLLVTLADQDLPVRVVYLDRDMDGELTLGTDVVMEFDEALGGWQATANFAGWQEGNNSFQVVVEVQNRWYGTIMIEGDSIILSSPDYWLDVTAPIGEYQASVPPRNTVSPNEVRTPGPGLVVVAAGVLAGAAVLRRRD